MINIIKKKEINKFIDSEFSKYTKAIILGKGPTYKHIDQKPDGTMVLSVNDVVNDSIYNDIMVANDIESYERIDDKAMKNIKNILVPEHPHKDMKYNASITYKNVINILENKFNGNLIVFNLPKSSQKDEEFIDLKTSCSSGNTAADFIGNFLSNIKEINFYGVGVEGGGYAECFKDCKLVGKYDKGAINKIRKTAEDSLEGRKVYFN